MKLFWVLKFSIWILWTGFFSACPLQTKEKLGGRFMEVKKGDVIQEVTVPGFLTPKRRLIVMPSYDGYIKKIYVQLGQTVHSGDPLVQIVSSPNGDEVGYPQRAQFTGKVVDVLKNEGEWVEKTKDNPILVIDDQSVFTVECSVPEIDISKYKMGLTATISPLALPNKKYQGRVTYVSQSSKLKDPNRWGNSAVEFLVKVEVLNPDSLLRSGLTTSVHIILESVKDVPVLSHEFVEVIDGKASVQKEDGTKVPVTLGMSDDHAVEIKSGLALGDRVRQLDFYAEKM